MPKLRFSGKSLTGTTPVPDKVIVWGLSLALSVIVTEPDDAVTVVGEKVTLMLQCAPAFTLGPQVFVSTKGVGATMLPILNAAVPVLVRVTTAVELVKPIGTLPKATLVLERETV
jgi:hypothetical protein